MDAEEATKTPVNLIGSKDKRSPYKNQLMFFTLTSNLQMIQTSIHKHEIQR